MTTLPFESPPKLGALHKSDILTKQELAARKAKILAGLPEIGQAEHMTVRRVLARLSSSA